MAGQLSTELFQKAFIQALFGFVDAQTACANTGKFSPCGRKNGKSA
jgi:phage terminase large subunit-like protein